MWLQKHGLAPRYLKQLKFEAGKPEMFLFDRPVEELEPLIKKASLDRLAPPKDPNAPQAVPLPRGSLNWQQQVLAGLGIMLIGLLTLLAALGRRVVLRRVRS